MKLILLLLIILFAGCTNEPPVPENYFSGTDKIKGGKPPSAVELSYESTSQLFTWTASIDPDSGSEVPEYFFYYAFGQLPRHLLDANYLEISVGRNRQLIINNSKLKRGSHYFWVTGFDGGRESLPSNVVRLER